MNSPPQDHCNEKLTENIALTFKSTENYEENKNEKFQNFHNLKLSENKDETDNLKFFNQFHIQNVNNQNMNILNFIGDFPPPNLTNDLFTVIINNTEKYLTNNENTIKNSYENEIKFDENITIINNEQNLINLKETPINTNNYEGENNLNNITENVEIILSSNKKNELKKNSKENLDEINKLPEPEVDLANKNIDQEIRENHNVNLHVSDDACEKENNKKLFEKLEILENKNLVGDKNSKEEPFIPFSSQDEKNLNLKTEDKKDEENKFNNLNIINNTNLEVDVHQNKISEKNSSNKQEIKTQKIINFSLFYYLFLFLIQIAIIILAFFAQTFSKLKSETFYFSEISKNWNLKPLEIIYLNTCQKTSDFIFQEYWPGTTTGCLCGTDLKQNSCPKNSSCQTINPNNPIPIELWRGSKICKKIQNLNYLNLNIAETGDKCPTGTRSCGLIDSYSNHMCLENNINCPVLKLQILTSNQEYKPLQNDITLNLQNGKLIFSANENENDVNKLSIPIQFKIGNSQPCKNPYFVNINSTPYILDYFYNRGVCKVYSNDLNNGNLVYDSTYQAVDRYKEEYLYSENVISSVTNYLPLFPKTNLDNDLTLFYKNYFGLKISCFKDIKEKKNSIKLMTDMDTIAGLDENNNMDATIAFTVISFLFSLGILFLGFYFRKSLKNKEKKFINSEIVAYIVYLILSALILGILLGYIILMSQKLSIFKLTPNFEKVFSDSTCVDAFTLDIYAKFIKNISYVRITAIICLALSVVNFISYFVFSILSFFYLKKSMI